MKERLRVPVLLSWLLAISLTTGCLSGCSGREDGAGGVFSRETPAAAEPTMLLRGFNEDEDSNLGAWGRAMGSVLISMNEGNPYYFGGYEATDANRRAAADILQSSWNIEDRRQLLRQIRQLLQKGSRSEYLREGREMAALSTKQRKKAVKQLSGELKKYYVNLWYNWKRWGERGLLAWDMCRISHLCQWGYIAGYLGLEEAQAMIEPAAVQLRHHFQNWDEVVNNWLEGYCFSASVPLGSHKITDYDTRLSVYNTLIREQDEKGLLYDDSLFKTAIIPLSSVSYHTIMKELKGKDKPEKKGSSKATKEPRGEDEPEKKGSSKATRELRGEDEPEKKGSSKATKEPRREDEPEKKGSSKATKEPWGKDEPEKKTSQKKKKQQEQDREDREDRESI